MSDKYPKSESCEPNFGEKFFLQGKIMFGQPGALSDVEGASVLKYADFVKFRDNPERTKNHDPRIHLSYPIITVVKSYDLTTAIIDMVTGEIESRIFFLSGGGQTMHGISQILGLASNNQDFARRAAGLLIIGDIKDLDKIKSQDTVSMNVLPQQIVNIKVLSKQ